MKSKFLVLVALGVSGCAPPAVYESVSVRMQGVTCTERLYFDDQMNADVNLSANGTVDTSVRLGGVAVKRVEPTPLRRCAKILAKAEEEAAIAVRRALIEEQRDELNLELNRVRNEEEIQTIQEIIFKFETDEF